MKRTLAVLLGIMLLTGVMVAAAEAVVPIEIESLDQFLLFDNETGLAASKLSIIFDQSVVLVPSDIIVFGGDAVKGIAITETFMFIEVDVVAGGTLQIILPEEYASAKVLSAFWFE